MGLPIFVDMFSLFHSLIVAFYLFSYICIALVFNMMATSLLLVCLISTYCSFVNGDDPPGHMKPIGSHAPPRSVDVLDYIPNPLEFYDNYVSVSKPVLFKGAAKLFPSFDNWKDDEYLKTKYGKWSVQAEEGKKENRSLGIQDMSYKKFLSIYAKSDIYLVQDVLPPNPMTKEVFLPKCLLCGGFTDYLSTAVMWFSSGGTKSVLHNDNFENINCLYDGSKELYMVDRKHKDLVPIDVLDGGYSSVDVEKVDMYKFPTLSKLEWFRAEMQAGDCFYIPLSWYHHVNSSMSRNLAINIWWNSMYDLPKRAECEKQVDQLSNYDALFNHKMADPIEQSRPLLFETFDEKTRSVTKEDFLSRFPTIMETDDIPDLNAFFEILDKDKNGVVTAQEVYDTPAEMLKPFLGEGPEGDFYTKTKPETSAEHNEL